MMIGFERPLALTLLILVVPLLYSAVRREDRFKHVTTLLHAVLVALLVVAVAGPTVAGETSVHREPTLTVLVDESMSASVLDRPSFDFDGVEVERRVIASGNTSDLKQSMLQHLEPDTNYLAVSDFQSEESLQGVAEQFNAVNSTLNAVALDGDEEAAVRVEGPETTVPGATTRFTVHVSATGEAPEPRVTLDGEEVALEQGGDEGVWAFTETFTSTGSHRIQAEIPVDDRYDVNDEYVKAVQVAEKPEILVVGEPGGLGAELEQFYEVTYRDSVPESMDDYYATVLKEDVDGLEQYAMEGNGIVYTGDPGDAAMDILPVRVAPDDDQDSGTKIVLAVDISVSTEGSGVKRSKQIAYNLVELLPFNNRLGAVAYNRDAFLVAEPQPLSLNREQVKEKIARLQPSGPSFHNNGITGAAELLNETGNIIWISDGKIGGFGANEQVPSKTRQAARDLDVRLITVAVGDDADRAFLRDVTRQAGGMFLDPSDSGRLQFMFSAGGASGETARLVVVDPNHFITEGRELGSSVAAFDPVEPRTGADLLVTGTGGQPFLSAWRYGLGRVAAFTGDDRELTRLRQQDPSLLVRTVSWAVGDPDRKRERWLDIGDAYVGEPVEVQASYPVEGLRRQGEDLYTGELEPDGPGFHTFAGTTYAYNYNPELSAVGYRDVENMVRRTGGTVFSPDDRSEIREQAVTFSSRQVPTKRSATNYILLGALLVFLGEVGYRKWNGRL